MKRYVIVDRRVSDSSYELYLVDTFSKLLVDLERYGDLVYWTGIHRVKTFDDSFRRLLSRNHLKDDEVEFISSVSEIPPELSSIIYGYKDDEVSEINEEDDDYYDEEEECLDACFDVCLDDQCYEECESSCI